jgi:hypothetical protein
VVQEVSLLHFSVALPPRIQIIIPFIFKIKCNIIRPDGTDMAVNQQANTHSADDKNLELGTGCLF